MGAPFLDFRNTNSLWCSVMVETLARAGLTHAVISPGSRSTALTVALARHPGIEAIPVLDERSAGFFALGLAKRRQRPVLLICTSGTAGANYFPAVIEAHESGTPLIVITADRPPEMRECNSGQTIDQQKIFSDYVRWYHEMAVPEASLERLRYARQTALHAWERASGPISGPVHLNAPFRDPLAPVTDDTAAGMQGLLAENFFSHVTPLQVTTSRATYWQRVTTARGLIVAGPAAPADSATYARAVAKLAEATGWPILGDALSTLRTHRPEGLAVITTYDSILRDERAAKELTPRHVLCLGGWPTSKVLRGWIEGSQAEILMVSPQEANRDALHGRTRQILATVESLAIQGGAIGEGEYREMWIAEENKTRAALDAVMTDPAIVGPDTVNDEFSREDGEPPLDQPDSGRATSGSAPGVGMFEGKAAWLLAQILPEGTPVFVASSMPVRDVEYFWPANGRGQRIFFNRGANGIDGTLSTALGIAHGDSSVASTPAVLLTGDLALLHDTNGFLSAKKIRGSLTIVLINNDGGGIFGHLPVAAFDPPFEEYFATPQSVDFACLASAYGVEHVCVRDWRHFQDLTRRLPESGARILEIKTDRKRDAALRKKLLRGSAVRCNSR